MPWTTCRLSSWQQSVFTRQLAATYSVLPLPLIGDTSLGQPIPVIRVLIILFFILPIFCLTNQSINSVKLEPDAQLTQQLVAQTAYPNFTVFGLVGLASCLV